MVEMFSRDIIMLFQDNGQEGNGSFGIQDLCFRQELLEYMDIHDTDASESSQPSWRKMCTSGTLLTLMLPFQLPGGKSAQDRDVGLEEADSKTSPKRSLRRKLFKTCCMIWGGGVSPTHAYYNGSRTSKDNEDPSWSISFKTRRTHKTSSALEALWKTLFVLYLYLIGTLKIKDWITSRNSIRCIHGIRYAVKCKYVTRNMGKGRKNEENADSYEGLWRNTYDSVTP
ncbi:hypothetical protein Tco_1119806 [Tanacetum coccineum]